jgi:hypothetical protein
MRERYLANTKIWPTGLKLAALLALCVSLANASEVLYWQDDVIGSSVIPGAITLAGDTGVAAASDTNFDALLTSQAWSAVIIDIENLPLTSYYSAIPGDLATYVNNGGLLIGDDYYTSTPGGDTGLASLFQATAVGNNASSITNDGSALFSGIAGNIGVYSSDWTVYDVVYNPTGTANGYGSSGAGYGIIEGSSGSGTTFLNGPLADAYTNLSQGQQLIANELSYATTATGPSSPATPEPGTMVLFGSGFISLALSQRRRRRP